MGIESTLFTGVSEILLPSRLINLTSDDINTGHFQAGFNFQIWADNAGGIEVGDTAVFSDDFTFTGGGSTVRGVSTTVTAINEDSADPRGGTRTNIVFDNSDLMFGSFSNTEVTSGSISFTGVGATIGEVIAPNGDILWSSA